MGKSSILFISTQLPYPPKSGGTIKSWNYLSDLCSRYTVGLASLLKDNDREHLQDFDGKLPLKEFIHEELQIKRSPLTLLNSYLGYPCLNVFRNYSKAFEVKLSKVIGQYDILLIDHYEMFQYVPKNFKGKVIMHTHNAEFELWKRMGELSKNPIKKLILNIEYSRVLAYEKKIFNRSDLIYATPSDIECYQKAGIPSDKFRNTYHLGNDEMLQLPNIEFEQTEKALLFMGTLSWEPNIDGLLWFINEVFPDLLKKHQDLKLYILGKVSDNRLTDAAKKYEGIELCGFINDLDSYLKISRVFLVPLRFGSGMKVKVLEGMYRGLPMVTTEIGAEGIDVKDGEELAIASSSQEFASKVTSLLEDKNHWEKLRDQSRKKAAEKYTWQPLFDQMDQDLRSIL